jgi:transcriptional regulator with XRE-family HTH domain
MTFEQLVAELAKAIASRIGPGGPESRNSFAERAGVAPATVSRLVNLRLPPSLEVFYKLAVQAGLSVELVGEVDGR